MGLIDRDEVSYASFRTDAADRWRIEVEATSLAYTVFAGPTPLEAPARFSVPSGRQPMPERWWFGLWYQSGHANRVPLERPSIEWRVLAEVPSRFWRFINAPASSPLRNAAVYSWLTSGLIWSARRGRGHGT